MMEGKAAYGFRPLGRADLPSIASWLGEPHVRQWWGDPETELALIAGTLDGDPTRVFMVDVAGTAFALIQVWDTALSGVYTDQPPGTRGIDQFIGDPRYLGRGHGRGLVAAMAERLLRDGAPRVVTDPDPANARAMKTYHRAGFRSLGPRDTPDGPVVLMARDPGQMKDQT